MTVSTLRPSSTSAVATSVVGAASTHAALNDDSDASYCTLSADNIEVGLGDLTLPAGAVIKTLAVRIRCLYSLGSTTFRTRVGLLTSLTTTTITWATATTVQTISAAGPFDDADIDAASLWIETTNGTGFLRFHEAYVDVTHVALPVVAVDAITDPVTTTNQPTISWVNTLDSDGGAQTFYQVRVFTDAQYLAGGFDPATSTATLDSTATAGSDTSWQATSVLVDDTYRAYVRVGQTVNGATHWSAYAYDEFTVDVDTPGTPTITATADTANGRIALAIVDVAGAAGTDRFELERSVDGGTTFEPVRTMDADGALEVPFVVASTSYSDSADGTSHAVTYPSPTGGILEDDLLIAVAGMDGNPSFTWPTGWTELKDEAGNGSAVRAGVAWYRAAGGESGTFTVTTSASEGGGIICLCVRHAHPTTAPEVSSGVSSSAANANPDSLNPSGWGTEPTLWIAAHVLDGNVATTAAPSGYFNLLNARWANASGAGVATAELMSNAASADPGAFTHTLEDSRAFTIGVRPRNASLTVYDYEAPNGTTMHYRARALHDYVGELAASAWVTDTEAWTSAGWWVKHPHRPDLNASLRVRSLKTKARAGRAGTFQALGSTSVVVVQDTRETARGEIVLRCDSAAEQAELDALLDETATLLIQGPAGSDEPGYVRVLGHVRERAVDWNSGTPSFDALEFVVVDEPDGVVVAWP
jgi:hypothetical protein